jgi:hypothetical protein
VPILWGLPSGSDPGWTAAVQQAGTKNILCFNEPNLTNSASSNILPSNAATGYKTYIEQFANSVKIGMLNVLWNNVSSSSADSYDSAQWTQYFLGIALATTSASQPSTTIKTLTPLTAKMERPGFKGIIKCMGDA